MLLEFTVLLLFLLDGGIGKFLVVSVGIAARLLPLVHFLMAALFEDSSAFTLSFITGVITLGRVGSGPAAAVAWSATWLAIGLALLELGLLFHCLVELIHLLLLIEAKRFTGLSFPIPLSLSSWLTMVVMTIIGSVRACTGVTFRELEVRAVLALQRLEDSHAILLPFPSYSKVFSHLLTLALLDLIVDGFEETPAQTDLIRLSNDYAPD